MFKKLLQISLLLVTITSATALAPKDPKYCTMLQDLKPGMDIGDVFLLMGPPHQFGQPPNLDINAVNTPKPVMQPQSSAPATSTQSRTALLQSLAADPILGAFMNAPASSNNVLFWNFEDNTLTVAVKVKGSKVTDVNANFSCT